MMLESDLPAAKQRNEICSKVRDGTTLLIYSQLKYTTKPPRPRYMKKSEALCAASVIIKEMENATLDIN
tara:strand:- start:1155 stop:1361 length:207 start_codon:yes stop_codon:yes gene_type:complete